MAGNDTDSEYESGAPGPSTKKKLRTEIVHKKCVTTYSRQDFKPSETQSTDNESRRGSPLQIIGDIVIEHDNNQMEVDDENPTIDHVQKPRQIIGVRLKKAPKTCAERARAYRARKALLKQQSKQQQEPDASTIASAAIRAKSAEATRRWRQKKQGVSESSKQQAKTVAQRMREYRKRKKLAKKILLKQQSDQDLDAIVSTSSSQVNQRAGPSTINSRSAELTRRGNSQSQQQIETSERTREYRERRNDNINIESNNPAGNNEEQSDLRDSTLTLKYDDITKHKKDHENFDRKFRKNPFGYSCTVCNRLWFKNDLKKASDNYEDLSKKITESGNLSQGSDEPSIFNMVEEEVNTENRKRMREEDPLSTNSPNELEYLKKGKLSLEIFNLKLANYKLQLEIYEKEKSNGISPSSFTRNFFMQDEELT